MSPTSVDGIVVRKATAADLPGASRLLEASGLPLDGVVEAFGHFVVAEEGGRLVGVGGLEIHGPDGVLRSVAVEPALRGRGVGARLSERLIADARDAGLSRMYLLTTTAETYFPRHGFRPIPREEASPEVRGSVEFREACPQSAIAMVLDLEEAG